jgi:hypothetical protein
LDVGAEQMALALEGHLALDRATEIAVDRGPERAGHVGAQGIAHVEAFAAYGELHVFAVVRLSEKGGIVPLIVKDGAARRPNSAAP